MAIEVTNTEAVILSVTIRARNRDIPMLEPQIHESAFASENVDALLIDIVNLRQMREQSGVRFELNVPRFSVPRGSFIGLVGESGCGKSTLLDVLALVIEPTSCDRFNFRYSTGQQDTRAEDMLGLWESERDETLAMVRRSQLGYILQSGGLLPFLTARQNLRLPLYLNGRQAQYERVEVLAEKIGIAEVLGKKPRYLSGGQRQRVAVLRAIIHHPCLVLADEPTAAVDRNRARHIVAELQTLAEAGGSSVVMVTHDPTLLEGVADCVWSFRVEQLSDTLTRSVCSRQR